MRRLGAAYDADRSTEFAVSGISAGAIVNFVRASVRKAPLGPINTVGAQ